MKTTSLLGGLAAACALFGQPPALAADPPNPHALPIAAPKPIDINSADLATLQELPGVTTTVARKIVAGRPYPTKAHLVTRKIVPDDVYEAIRTRVAAVQPPRAKARKTSRAASSP